MDITITFNSVAIIGEADDLDNFLDEFNEVGFYKDEQEGELIPSQPIIEFMFPLDKSSYYVIMEDIGNGGPEELHSLTKDGIAEALTLWGTISPDINSQVHTHDVMICWSFETQLLPPADALCRMSMMFPSVYFTNVWNSANGSHGLFIFKDGLLLNEWTNSLDHMNMFVGKREDFNTEDDYREAVNKWNAFEVEMMHEMAGLLVSEHIEFGESDPIPFKLGSLYDVYADEINEMIEPHLYEPND